MKVWFKFNILIIVIKSYNSTEYYSQGYISASCIYYQGTSSLEENGISLKRQKNQQRQQHFLLTIQGLVLIGRRRSLRNTLKHSKGTSEAHQALARKCMAGGAGGYLHDVTREDWCCVFTYLCTYHVCCVLCCVGCAVCCVLCAVCAVLCVVCCVLYAVLCDVCCVLCAVCCVLCAVCCVLCAVCCVLCAVCCVLCVVCCAVYCYKEFFEAWKKSIKQLTLIFRLVSIESFRFKIHRETTLQHLTPKKKEK